MEKKKKGESTSKELLHVFWGGEEERRRGLDRKTLNVHLRPESLSFLWKDESSFRAGKNDTVYFQQWLSSERFIWGLGFSQNVHDTFGFLDWCEKAESTGGAL